MRMLLLLDLLLLNLWGRVALCGKFFEYGLIFYLKHFAPTLVLGQFGTFSGKKSKGRNNVKTRF